MGKVIDVCHSDLSEKVINVDTEHINRILGTDFTGEYMKELLHDDDMREEGRAEERANTEREKANAEREKTRADEQEARADAQEARANTQEARADALEARVRELEGIIRNMKQ